MKPHRLVYAPTRSRRLNEMFGLVLLALAGLLLLALLTYWPSDPSFNTVGAALGTRPARNWTGLLGSYTADLLLQIFGVAVLFVPLAIGRVGVSWVRSRASGSGVAKTAGVILWLLFAPACLALLPIHLLWRGAVPVSGAAGRVLAEELIHFVNYPGAAILCSLMVVLSLYLTTTFLLTSAREWFTERFGFARTLRARWAAMRLRRRRAAQIPEEAFTTRGQRAVNTPKDTQAREPETEKRSLWASFVGWFTRRKGAESELSVVPHDDGAQPAEPQSVWQTMPRTLVDAPVPGPLSAATAAAAPFAAQLAAAAAPLRGPASEPLAAAATLFEPAADFPSTSIAAPAEDDDWLNAPERQAPTPLLTPAAAGRVRAGSSKIEELKPGPQLVPRSDLASTVASAPLPSPMADIAAQNISFGKRADADTRSTSLPLPPKSVRGYKLPSSELLFRSTEHTTVREEALREEAKVLVEKCAEFGVSGVVEQINPGPVVTTFEFRPDAGVKYSRVTGLADDLCLAMAAESILIERMPGKSHRRYPGAELRARNDLAARRG